MSGFNNGLQGITTGSAMNSAGRMYHGMARSASSPASSPEVRVCASNEVAWHSTGDCFVPTQVHINIAAVSVTLNAVLILVLVFALRRRAR